MDRSKKFANIRFNKSDIKDTILKALDHVNQFIIKKKLILVGGMSIDFNMRLKGQKLYDDDTLPDYDFYSPDNATHAYELGNELCKAEFPNVDVITAIHTTTMKVRVDGNVVADITYVPKNLFDQIETNEYKGMRIIHPHYIMMDQFRSLAIPYENPPNEVINDRWNKDVDRFNLLNSVYELPFVENKYIASIEMVEAHIPYSVLVDKPMLTGWAALAIHQNIGDFESRILQLKYEETKSGIILKLPAEQMTQLSDNKKKNAFTTISLMSTEPYKVASKLSKDKRAIKAFAQVYSFPQRLDINVEKSGIGKYEIYDVFGERFTMEHIPDKIKSKNVRIASLASIMFYFLNKVLFREDELAKVGVMCVEELLHERELSVRAYSKYSWNTATLYSIARIINSKDTMNWKPSNQSFEDDCSIKRSFNPDDGSPLFMIDGDHMSELIELVKTDVLEISQN